MENNEEMWLQYMRQRTENSRDFLNRTGLVFGAGFGPGAAFISAPMFGMMMVSAQTGIFNPVSTVSSPGNTQNVLYTNPMLSLWDMALNNPNQQGNK